MDNSLFWERVKQLLKDQHKTQVDLCQESGIILGTFKGWIVNNRLPDAESSVLIAKGLNTSVEYLITGLENEQLEKTNQLITDLENLIQKYK